jgi:hypothetical protein
MDIKDLAAGIAECVLGHTKGPGSWVTYGVKTNRIVADDDLAKGLQLGDLIYSFDTDEMRFDESVVVYVDANEVAYRVSDFNEKTAPALNVVWNSWAKTKREALLALPCDIKKALQEAIAEL